MTIRLLVAALWILAAPAHAAELVVDGGFDDPAHAAWEFQKYDVTSVIERSNLDATGDLDSGSLYLDKAVGESPNSLRATQCIRVVPGAEYQLSGRLFWPSTSLDENGTAYVVIQWNAAELCNGLSEGDFYPSLFGVSRDAWVEVGPFTGTAPLGAAAAQIYVGVVANTDESSDRFVARWDDVSFVPEPGAVASLAAVTALATLARRR